MGRRRSAIAALAVTLAQGTVADDDHGDTYAESSILGVGSSVPGELGEDDTDMFRLELVGTAEVEVRTAGQTDTRGELLDSSGARLMSDDDGGSGENFSIEATMEPGVYYVSVEGDVGTYTVNARLGGARDHGGTPESSTVLKLHTRERLAEVHPSVLLATSGRIHPSTDDIDVFRIDVVEDGTAVSLRTAPATYDTYGVLTDPRGNQIVDDARSGAFRIETTLDSGVYYVSVSAMEVGGILGQGDHDTMLKPDSLPEPDAPLNPTPRIWSVSGPGHGGGISAASA